MRKILVVGGSSGIGKSILIQNLPTCEIINFSRTEPPIQHVHLKHYAIDILKDELPSLESLDAVVYCPGSIVLKPFGRLSRQDFMNDMEINFFGAVHLIQKYLENLKSGTSPSILLFSTVAVKMGMGFHASIASAKGAVEGLVKSLAAEFIPTIRVNAIAPTLTDTPLAKSLLRNDLIIEKMIERHPLKKILSPEEVAELATFLISERSGSITGQIFQMDCGIVSVK